MKTNSKDKTITFRLTAEQHQKCIDIAIIRSQKENRLVKISEIIREAIEKGLKR